MNDTDRRSLAARLRATAGLLMLLLIALAPVAHADDQERFGCGELENAYGPYDYTDPVKRRDNLPIVEQFHFTRSVESLSAGRSSSIIGDLDYTLRAFPNHHRALYAMARYQLDHPEQPGGRWYTIDCYFDRAIRFRPQDGTVHMIYGIYLARKGQSKEALDQYQEALTLLQDSAEVHYNMGLLYVEMGEFGKAREHAEKAYSLGYPLPGLRNQLISRGEWHEPAATPPNG
ncbi:MAG TPA: tetratricopeptide repeat protein [Steroidobacteraceae bacterium]|nr:tetratricopeptide repeat protein [Steroidobacteraceae bacterium]